MNVRTTVILLVLLVLCLAYVIVFHTGLLGRGPKKPGPEEPDGKRLLEKAGTVERLVLAGPGAAKIVLVKRDDKWHLAEPVDAPAVGWQSDSTVTTVTNLKIVRKYAPDDYQLVKIKDKWAIDTPVSARADQDKVKSLLGDISNISAEKFADDAPKDLAAYGLTRPRLAVTVELAPPEPKTKPPETAPATAPATRPAKPKKGKVITIAFGALADPKEKHVFAKLADRPWVFQVKDSLLKDLQPKLLDLRDKRVLDITGKETTRIEVALSKGGSCTVEKIKGDWHMKAPFEGPADESAVIGLISAVRDELTASEFQDNPTSLAAFGLQPPEGKILLHFRGSDQTTTLELGRSSDSGQMGFVRPANSRSVAVVPSAQFAKLLHPAPAYWRRKVFELPDDAEIMSVELDRADGQFALRRGEDEEFTLARPVSAPADKENVDALLGALKKIQADKNVSLGEALPKRFAGAKPIRVKLTYRVELPPEPPASQPATAPATKPASAPGTRPATAPATKPAKRYKTRHAGPFLTVKDKNKSYVWAAGAKPLAVGELEAGFHDKLAAELRDRTILQIDPDKTTSFKMDLEKVSLEFKRAGDVWQYAADTFVKVDAAKIKEFLKTLSEVKATRFVDYGAKPRLKRFGLDKPAMTLRFATDAGKTLKLSISRTGPVGVKGHYAVSSEAPGVFVLGPETPEKMKKKLKDFQKSD